MLLTGGSDTKSPVDCVGESSWMGKVVSLSGSNAGSCRLLWLFRVCVLCVL